jgi:hypothetical protein
VAVLHTVREYTLTCTLASSPSSFGAYLAQPVLRRRPSRRAMGLRRTLSRQRVVTACLQGTFTLSVPAAGLGFNLFPIRLCRFLSTLVVVSCCGQLSLFHGLVDAIVLPMPDEQEHISEAALEAVGNLLEAAKTHGIGVTFEPDAAGWRVGYMEGMGGGDLASAYDLETAVKAAERPLDELAARRSAARAAR